MSDRREWRGWYDSLKKPSWTPAGGTIGTIWSLLYPIIIVFGYSVFRVRNLGMAAADILAVLASVALLPYLIWVSTGPVLQLSITWTNRPRRS